MSAFGAKSRLSPYCFHTAHLSSARIGKFISILHQTTTPCRTTTTPTALFLISILHQTTTSVCSGIGSLGCFLFPFYIKPQRKCTNRNFGSVVSYFHSTSNHNSRGAGKTDSAVVSYFHSTSNHNDFQIILSERKVVSYFHSTSNHNFLCGKISRRCVVSYFHSTSNHNLGYAIC